MSVTRGDFLKSLGKSLPGIVLGSGVAAAAQKFLTKMAAASGGPMTLEKKPTPLASAKGKAEPAEFIYSGPPSAGNRIALTFDDGPAPGETDRILDELQRRGAHATFFMIGQSVAASPDLARRVLAEGHTVANHSYTHPHLNQLSDAQAAEEIQKTQDVMVDVLGHRPVWFRAPYCAFRQDQAPLANNRGLRIVVGNVDPADWSQPGEDKIIGTILRETKPGSIIICHDTSVQTANAIGAVLDGLLERGLTPVTMTALMGE